MRSPSNYRLYTKKDVLRLQRIVALKQQGFQLNHIRNILEVEPETDTTTNLMGQLQLITVEGTLGGGALAATALNALVESLIDKPDCHCYLS